MVKEGKEGEKAWTKYQVLAVPAVAPHKCALIQLQAITGTNQCQWNVSSYYMYILY